MKITTALAALALTFAAVRAADHPLPAADAKLPPDSIYHLEAVWTNQHGRPVRWSESVGLTRVVALGYASCQGICPRVIADMQRIENGLAGVANVRFTFVTLDPKADDVAAMHRLAAAHRCDPARWDLLTGDEDAVLELAVALGVRHSRLPNGIDFAHSYLIAVLGPDGRVRHKWTDPKHGPAAAIAAARGR